MANKDKKIFRSNTDYVIAGVCGGLADYFNVDSTIVRIIFILLTVWGGTGILVYLILWLLIPRSPGKIKEISRDEKIKEFASNIGQKAKTAADDLSMETNEIKHNRGSILGVILVLIGFVALWNQFMPTTIRWDVFWPIVAIGIGLYLVFRK